MISIDREKCNNDGICGPECLSPLFEALGLPADHLAFGAMMIGYPKFKYRRIPVRNRPRVTWK